MTHCPSQSPAPQSPLPKNINPQDPNTAPVPQGSNANMGKTAKKEALDVILPEADEEHKSISRDNKTAKDMFDLLIDGTQVRLSTPSSVVESLRSPSSLFSLHSPRSGSPNLTNRNDFISDQNQSAPSPSTQYDTQCDTYGDKYMEDTPDALNSLDANIYDNDHNDHKDGQYDAQHNTDGDKDMEDALDASNSIDAHAHNNNCEDGQSSSDSFEAPPPHPHGAGISNHDFTL
ncbi:hypothetical protein M422DRAFT_272642 [Sphaerobolus stellatus SS14]|uniref:Uncharacterized protein n=1 Tax=Sphaerobolus stellatus (strain SS14) TaxID=990650 RepID=A0A0C9TB10_SPHS4|nr:hypothetical protein M422DRAFT_272642 [Sphaerobolus stellatus SS14]